MSIRTNTRNVAARWAQGQTGANGTSNYRTDGLNLYSYNLMIGTTANIEGRAVKILRDYTSKSKWGFKSMTTSTHVGYARQHADIVDG